MGKKNQKTNNQQLFICNQQKNPLGQSPPPNPTISCRRKKINKSQPGRQVRQACAPGESSLEGTFVLRGHRTMTVVVLCFFETETKPGVGFKSMSMKFSVPTKKNDIAV